MTAVAVSRKPAPPRYTTHWVDDWSALDSLREVWDALAQVALERSPSSESWMLLPALHHLAPASVRVLLVYAERPAAKEAAPTLCGVFPLEVLTRYKGLPIKVLRAWNHSYSLFPAPLLAVEHAEGALRAMLDWVRDTWPATTLIEFPDLRGDSAFFRLITDVAREDGLLSHALDLHTRAFFRPRRSADDYLNGVSTPHHRHEMRRQERRLRELGTLEFEVIAPGADVTEWLKEFIALEMAGWKGKEGTAFGSQESHRQYLEEVAGEAARRQELMLLGLRLDGKPIALKLNFVCGDGGYTFKIAFDETYSKYSPGILVELENIRQAHANPNISWLDSLALPDHSMMNRVWRDRTTIVTQLIAPGRAPGQLVLGAFPLMRALKRALGRGA